jgi:hypothetical protein
MKVESLEAIVRELNNAAVPFLVVGGIAVNAHGYGRLTNDVDIVIQMRADTIKAAFKSLASIGYLPRVPITAEQFADAAQRTRWIAERNMQVLNFHSEQHRETPIDVFVQEPFDFNAEYANALVQRLADDVPVRVVSLEALLKMKREAGRPQDLTDAAELLSLHRGHASE